MEKVRFLLTCLKSVRTQFFDILERWKNIFHNRYNIIVIYAKSGDS